jgi:hypothetical protein
MSERDNSINEPGLAREVLSYFVKNPLVNDTLENVVRIRLTEVRVRLTVLEVSESLEWLVDRGFLKMTPRVGVGAVYFLNEDRLAEANQFLIRNGTTPKL